MTENMQADEALRLLPVVFRGALNIKAAKEKSSAAFVVTAL